MEKKEPRFRFSKDKQFADTKRVWFEDKNNRFWAVAFTSPNIGVAGDSAEDVQRKLMEVYRAFCIKACNLN